MNRTLIRRVDARFTRWQRELIFEVKRHGKWDEAPSEVTAPIRERQERLIASVRGGPSQLGQYLREELGLGSADKIEAPPLPRDALTPSEYREPPLPLEREIGKEFKSSMSSRRAQASSPLFWFLCHIVWIEQGSLGTNGHTLQEALLGGRKKREARIRNLLRRTGGLAHVRGNISVFSDCPIARAWWRYALADEVARTTEGLIDQSAAHWLFHKSRECWETLVLVSLRRLTTISQAHARAAITQYLGEKVRTTSGGFDKKDVEAVAMTLARLSLRRSLDHTPLEELYRMVNGSGGA